MYIKTYKELIVWQKSIELVIEIYSLTREFPESEIYGITSQMMRAAISVPSNIAEGYGRKSTKSYGQFYAVSYGSALELETQIIIAKRLNFASKEKFSKAENLLIEVSKMLNSMITKIRSLTTSG